MEILIPIAHAASTSNAEAFGKVVGPIINHVVNPIIELMFAIAVFVFAFGIFQMVWHSEDGDKRAEGKKSVGWGLLGMFIMMSAWGIVYVISNTLKSI
jgi:hypothetical protein